MSNQTLSEQINALINQEKENMNNNMGLAMQLFGAEVDDNGQVVQGGKRGFRVITHVTEHDSDGLDEGQVYSSERELVKLGLEARTDEEREQINKAIKELRDSDAALMKSAEEEVVEFQRLVRMGEAQRSAFHFEVMEREAAIVKEWEEGNIDDDEANGQLDGLKGCLVDLTDKDLNAYFVERELDESSPELLGFKFEAPTFSRLFDETEKEYVQFKKDKLEKDNWPHLQGMADDRVKIFERMKVEIRSCFDDARRLKHLGYNVIYREELAKFNRMKNKIWAARNYSFAGVLLDSLEPSVKGKEWWAKQRHYLSRNKDSQTYKVYNQSRGLTFEQATFLINGWTIMSNILTPKGK